MTPLTRLLPLALLLFAGSAHAQSADEAERTRLSEEMKRLSTRNAWRGVDESYRRLEALMEKGVVVSYKDHFLGAQAARELGDLNGVYVRLQRAKAAEDTEEVRAWLGDIEANYGPVKLRVDPKFGGDASLAIAEMPFAPDQRRAIEAAQIALKDTRSYNGLLPLGAYTFGGQAFEIKPGGGAPMEMALLPSSMRESGGGGGLSYVGPRADVGLSWLQTTAPADDVLAAGAFGGPGARLGVGVEVGFTTTLGLVAEVGYHNLLAGAPDGVPENMGAQGTSMHLGYGWLAAAFRAGDLRIAAGPVYGLGVAKTTGMNEYCLTATNDPACSGVGSDETTLDYTSMTGSIRAGGAELGVFYGFLNFGNLQSGLGLHAGALKDDARWYPWGQIAFTVAPAAYRRDG